MLKYQIFLFCFFACLISWGSKFFMSVHDTGRMDHDIPLGILQLLAQFGPSIAGVIMIFAAGGKKGMSGLFKSLTRFHIHFKWYIFALFFELILFLVIVLFSDFFGLATIKPGADTWFNSLKNFIINTVILSLLTGLGEEIGWRGFLLPRLQSRFTILAGALILALINSLWHLRTLDIAFLLDGNLQGFCDSFFPDMGLRIFISVPVIFVMVYLFNKTKGSLVVMVLFHGASNASYEWVKETTGINDPSFTLPFFAFLLWLTSVFFIQALIRQGKRNEMVTELF
jgi:uncharacterized protein